MLGPPYNLVSLKNALCQLKQGLVDRDRMCSTVPEAWEMTHLHADEKEKKRASSMIPGGLLGEMRELAHESLLAHPHPRLHRRPHPPIQDRLRPHRYL